MGKRRKTTALLLAVCLFALSLPARAVDGERRDGCAVIGEDLTNAQTREAYDAFGFPRGSVTELPMTGAEERQLLEGVPEEQIGTSGCTCVYLRLLPEGSGSRITVSGSVRYSPEAYRAALETAGITDVELRVAAPVSVSGLAALPEAWKAWEYLTGGTVDEDLRQMSLGELTAAAELAYTVGDAEAVSLLEKIRSALDQTSAMSDEELADRIRTLAEEYKVKLNDTQVQMLMDLCRRAEKLSDSQVTDRIDGLKDTMEKIEEFGEKKEEIKENVSGFAGKLKRFFENAADFFRGLFR